MKKNNRFIHTKFVIICVRLSTSTQNPMQDLFRRVLTADAALMPPAVTLLGSAHRPMFIQWKCPAADMISVTLKATKKSRQNTRGLTDKTEALFYGR